MDIQICAKRACANMWEEKKQICANTNMWKHKYVQIQRCTKKGVCCEDRTCCMEGFTCLPPPTGGCGLTRRNDTDSSVRSTVSFSFIYCFSSVRVWNGCRESLLLKPPLLQFCPSSQIPNSWDQISNSWSRLCSVNLMFKYTNATQQCFSWLSVLYDCVQWPRKKKIVCVGVC